MYKLYIKCFINEIKYILNGVFMFGYLYKKKFFFLINKYVFNYGIIVEWFFYILYNVLFMK